MEKIFKEIFFRFLEKCFKKLVMCTIPLTNSLIKSMMVHEDVIFVPL